MVEGGNRNMKCFSRTNTVAKKEERDARMVEGGNKNWKCFSRTNTVAKLVRPIVLGRVCSANAHPFFAAVVSVDPVYQPSGSDVCDCFHPDLSGCRLRPIKDGNVAVHVAIVAEREHCPKLVTQVDWSALRLKRLHLGVRLEHGKVELRVPVHDCRLVWCECLQKHTQKGCINMVLKALWKSEKKKRTVNTLQLDYGACVRGCVRASV